MNKSLYDISWQTSEPEYRKDPALSYSTLAKFEREGFSNLSHLFEHISTPSLTLGSIVDTLITGSQEEFEKLFYVADIPSIGDKELLIAKTISESLHGSCTPLNEVEDEIILAVANNIGYYTNWKDTTRIKVIRERCSKYISFLALANGRSVVSLNTYNKAARMVDALKESVATSGYFADNNPDSPIQRYYQLKFKSVLDRVAYRCMADLILVDYENKVIIPCDLKTSGHPEWEFQDSFLTWKYMIQARLYWRLIRKTLDNDPYFKDFELKDYRFIVVNKDTLTPLVWEFPYTQYVGTLIDDKGNEYRDPCIIGRELRHYLDERPQVPEGISIYESNKITILKPKDKHVDESN